MSKHMVTARLQVKLVLVAGAPRQEYGLSPAENTIGRSADASITIDDPLASRIHCKILKRGSDWALIDLNSENGTLLNGNPVRESALGEGDQIRVGRLTFYFSLSGTVPPNEKIEIFPPRPAARAAAGFHDQATPVLPMPAASPRRGAQRSRATTPTKPGPRPKRSTTRFTSVAGTLLAVLAAASAWFWMESRPAGDNLPTDSTDISKMQTRGIERTTAATDAEALPSLYNELWAVVVGVDQYPNLGRRDQLQYAVSDAKAIEVVLREDLGFAQIHTLYNQDATKTDILAALDTYLGQAEADDAVFVFFAGHGHTEATAYGDVGYILPHDGSFDAGEMYRNISMSALSEIAKRIKAKHVFFAMDSCYSGQLLSRTRGSDSIERGVSYERLKSLTSRRVRQVLTAGGKGEVVLDDGPFGHSVFTGRLIEALQGSADFDEDGFITVAELELYVGDKVFEDARRRGKQQNPQFGKLFSGEGMFVFQLSPPSSSPES